MARHLPEVLRLPGICRPCGNEGPDPRRLYEETGSGIGTKGPEDAGRLQRRVENLLKEIWLVLQYSDRGHQAGPSEHRPEPVPEPSRPEPSSPPTSTPGTPPTGAPSASTPRPEATSSQPEPASMPVIPDPTR